MKLQEEKGMAALVSVLIISATVLIIAVNSAIIARTEMDMSISSDNGLAAQTDAESCAYEALRQISLDNSYLVTELTLLLDGSLCRINVSASSSDRLVRAESDAAGFYKEINLSVKISSSTLAIYDWRER